MPYSSLPFSREYDAYPRRGRSRDDIDLLLGLQFESEQVLKDGVAI